MTLDDAYANAAHIPGAEEFPPRWSAAAALFRAQLGAQAEVGVSYGPSERQTYDLFQPEGTAQGAVIFVHGGYWKAFDPSVWSHLAAGPLARGWAVAMPGYDLCPNVRISDITRQIAAAVTAIAARTQGPLVLTGHSAGGHLVGRMLADGMLAPQVRARIVRVVPISPVADLEPLLQTSMNDILHLDETEAQAESVTRMPPPEGVEVTVWVGGDERPAFLDQARWMAEAWDVTDVVVTGKHHFDVIDALAEPDSDLVNTLCGAA